MGRGEWTRILRWSLLGTALCVVLALVNLSATHDTLGGLLTTAPTMPAAGMLRQDLPDEPLLSGGQHDGPYFYAIAREPMHLDHIAANVDRPRYRLQRIFFPLVSWALHPVGGGPGLVWTMFVVNALGVLIGSLATGRLSTQLGGPAWPAAVFGVLFGSIVALRITTPDPLSLGLGLLAVALALDERWRWALVAAVAAALTRETILLTFIGFALWRRDRKGVALVVVPAAAVALWYLFLVVQVGGPNTNDEFVAPFRGVLDAARFWSEGNEPMGLLSFVLGIGLAVAALVRARPRHPLYWAIVLNLAIVPFLSVNVLGPERNVSRVFLTLQVLGLVAVLTAGATNVRASPPRPTPRSLHA